MDVILGVQTPFIDSLTEASKDLVKSIMFQAPDKPYSDAATYQAKHYPDVEGSSDQTKNKVQFPNQDQPDEGDQLKDTGQLDDGDKFEEELKGGDGLEGEDQLGGGTLLEGGVQLGGEDQQEGGVQLKGGNKMECDDQGSLWYNRMTIISWRNPCKGELGAPNEIGFRMLSGLRNPGVLELICRRWEDEHRRWQITSYKPGGKNLTGERYRWTPSRVGVGYHWQKLNQEN